MTTEQLPELLEVAISHIEELGSIIAARYADHTGKVHPSRVDRVAREVETCNAAIDAIRAEHHQRVTLQNLAAGQAQRIAQLEAERDELRAKLAEIEGQEPTLEIRRCGCHEGKNGRCVMGNYGAIPIGTKLYARLVPAIKNGCGDACKSRQSCRLADESPAPAIPDVFVSSGVAPARPTRTMACRSRSCCATPMWPCTT